MIGIFVGSFDPPHKAHLEIGKKLLEENLFSKIIYVPVNSSKKTVSLEKRIEMLKLVLEDKMDIYNIENRKFNYHELDKINKEFINIKIIIGSDLLVSLKNFDYYEDLLKKYSFVIIPRFNIDNKKIIHEYYCDYQDKFSIFNYNSSLSSSSIKENLKNGFYNENELDLKIINYIKSHHLYTI